MKFTDLSNISAIWYIYGKCVRFFLSQLSPQLTTTCYNESEIESDSRTMTATEGSLTDLSPLSLCCIRVAARNSCPGQPSLIGPLSEMCEVTDDIVPGTVGSLAVTGVNRQGLLVTWDPPDNYRRSGLEYVVSVSSSNFATKTDTVVDRGYYYLGSLESAKEFTVSVSARSGTGTGPMEEAVGITLSDAPPPPSDPELSVVNSDTLRLSWTPVDGSHQVTGYRAVMRCNEDDPDVGTTDQETTSVDFTVTNPGSDFAWCTAQVQTENSVGLGQFSELVSIAIPSRPPSTPRCYLVDDQGLAVFISFDVTHPFSLDSLSVRYRLVADFEDPATVGEQEKAFTSSNVLSLNVSRNTRYEFELRLCNVHGCGGYCSQLRNFTTSSVSAWVSVFHTCIDTCIYYKNVCV